MAVEAVRRGQASGWLWIILVFGPVGAAVDFFSEYVDLRFARLRWLIAGPGPTRTRLATFTLAVPEAAGLDPLTGDVVALLEREICAARVDGGAGA